MNRLRQCLLGRNAGSAVFSGEMPNFGGGDKSRIDSVGLGIMCRTKHKSAVELTTAARWR